jgi:TolA-binding protein
MKRTERHHLKENELERLTRLVRESIEARKREATLALAALAVVGGVALGYYLWHAHVQGQAYSLLAQALSVQDATVGPPPATTTSTKGAPAFLTEQARSEAALVKFKAAADAYPTTDAGIFARYQEAATLMTLARPADAASRYQDVISRAGTSLYGQMARLGVAEAQARAGQYDQAITAFKELAQRKDGPLPVDGVLMQLARTYVEAGKRTDAEQTFNRVLEEFPASPYASDARRDLETLKKT